MSKPTDIFEIEEQFFDIDKQSRTANIKLCFNKASDVFDKNYVSKVPILSDDFLDWIKSAFRLIPSRYKIALDVSFTDMEGYSEAELKDIFDKNILLEYKSRFAQTRRKNRVAYSLIILGVVFFALMMTMNALWQDGGIVRDAIAYISDIATTVTLWEAMCILIVEGKERRSYNKGLITRFKSISFHASES